MKRPTLSQCFPNPLTRQWPATSNPVSCECQQLYALVCICCCLPKTHLLVLHEGESNNMVTSMPKGPKYVDYKITPRTTGEDLSSFLYRAELAAGQAQQQQMQLDTFADVAMQASRTYSPTTARGSPGEDQIFSPASPSAASGDNVAPEAAPLRPVHSATSVAAAVSRPVVVVCLHGIAVASPAVRSVLMDSLTFAQVPYNRAAKAIPSLRIVAFCDYRACIAILSEPLRAAFALSTFVSSLSMDSAVVLQSTDPRSSNVVNKEYMQEVMNTHDGLSLVDTVVLSSAVARYMRHLLMTVQGSTLAELAPGSMLLRRTTFFYRLLKVAAVLFMPHDDLFTRRVNPRMAYRGAGATATGSVWGDGFTSQPNSTTFGARRAQSSHAAAVPPATPVAGSGAAEIAFAPNKSDNGRVFSFSHVVVSPSDVICLIPAMVTHHLSLHRAVADVESRLLATRATMAGLVAPLISDIMTTRTERNAGAYQENGGNSATTRSGATNVVCEDGSAGCPAPGLWDARMASLALARRPHTSVVAATVASRAQRQQFDTSDNQIGSTITSPNGPVEYSLQHTLSITRPRSAQDQGNTPTAHRSTRKQVSPPSPSLGETWRGGEARSVLANMYVDESDFLYHDYLNYCELRDVVRATLVCRSLPAPA